ncbi:MAG: dihydroneopterin triphosphate diphosphatase [Candidatus Berkiella sp.]
MPEYKRPESVLVVVYTQNSQVLLLQRNDWPDFWQSVTGSLHENESPLEGAIRELKEETGLTPNEGLMQDVGESHWFDIYPAWQHRYQQGVTQNLEHVFCFIVKKPIKISMSNEHQDYCWVTKEESLTKMISSTNQEAVKKYVP